MVEIKSLADLSLDKILTAFEQAFIDYEIEWDKEEIVRMLSRRGFAKELSFGAFHNDNLVGFTLNGIGEYIGVSTAYDTGTGTLKEYRGKGIATDIFNYSVPFLKEAGVKQYLLEVLQNNSKAISVYSKIGFKVTREFNYFDQLAKEIVFKKYRENKNIKYINIDLSHRNKMKKFWDTIPSWQNSFASIYRSPDDFVMLGATNNDELIGYCILAIHSGDITQIAVGKEYRRKGVATSLLNKILCYNKCKNVKAINYEVGYDNMVGFFNSVNITLGGKQFEMIKKL